MLIYSMNTSVDGFIADRQGAFAWTTVVLVAAAGYVRARRISRSVAWIALGAFGSGLSKTGIAVNAGLG